MQYHAGEIGDSVPKPLADIEDAMVLRGHGNTEAKHNRTFSAVSPKLPVALTCSCSPHVSHLQNS